LVVQDRDLRVTWACGRIVASSQREVTGATDDELFGLDAAEALTAVKRRVLADGVAARERIALTTGGREVEYDVYVSPDRLASGDIIGLTSVMTQVASEE
jgi:hypothetical protein